MNYKKLVFLSLGIGVFLMSACLDDSGDTFDAAKQFGLDTVKIDAYLDSKGIDAEIELLSRIRYVILEEGTGKNPDDTSTVVVNYVGRFIPSDEKFGEADTVTFQLNNNIILGWRIGLPLIKEGGSIQLFLPSYYGYGYYGSRDGTIPSNTCLTFDIDLIKLK